MEWIEFEWNGIYLLPGHAVKKGPNEVTYIHMKNQYYILRQYIYIKIKVGSKIWDKFD